MADEDQQSGSGKGSEQEADDPGEFELVEVRKGEDPPDRKG